MIAEGLNLTTIIWSDDTDDWAAGTNGITEQDVTNNYQSVIDKAGNGTYTTHGPVVLNHELSKSLPTTKSMFAHDVLFSQLHHVCLHDYVPQDQISFQLHCPHLHCIQHHPTICRK